MFIANPLIKRGLNVRAAYIHGQDVGITTRADGTEGMQDVNSGNCYYYAKADDKLEQESGNELGTNSCRLNSERPGG